LPLTFSAFSLTYPEEIILANALVFVTIPCVNLEGAGGFYGQALGLAEMERFQADESPAVLYQGGQGTTLLVYQRSTPTKADHTATRRHYFMPLELFNISNTITLHVIIKNDLSYP
jgi:hypothetical protein